MNFKDLNIKYSNEYNIFNFNNNEIKVLKYLPTEDKFDLIMTALQKSIIDGVSNPIRLQTFFELNIVYLYTDLVFDIDERVNEGLLYDKLKTSGLLGKIMENIEESESLILSSYLNQCLEIEKTYSTSAAAIISKLINDLPKNAESAKQIVDTFDEKQYAKVIEFAKSLQTK